MSSSNIKISRVKSGKDLKKFIKLPWTIYKDNPYWVPPLLRDVKFKLNAKKHPFFAHARAELFIAAMGRKVVGRIAAIVNQRHIEFHRENVGFFGMFECIENYDVARLLFSAAEQWCAQAGMDVIRGPVNLSTNDECGFLMEGFDSPPVVMMPYNPPYYLPFCERYGFEKAKDLYAYFKKEIHIPERLSRIVSRVIKKTGVVVRPLDMKNFDRDTGIIKDIYNASFELNWGFVPLTAAEMDQVAKELKPIVEPELVLFAEIKGEPIGVSIALPDINQVLKKLNGRLGPLNILRFLYYKRKINGLRAIIFGVKKEYRNMGINAVLYYETEKRGRKLGYEWCEMSWNLEDNDLINRFDEAIGGKIYKKYRIYEKIIVHS